MFDLTMMPNPKPIKIKVVHVGAGTWEATAKGIIVRAQSPDKAKYRLMKKLGVC